MKVYAVMAGDDEEYLVHLFATRELAEGYLGKDRESLRRQYDRLVDKAGRVIPRRGYKDGKGGIIPQREPHPGSFEAWCRGQGTGWIEEMDLLTELPVVTRESPTP